MVTYRFRVAAVSADGRTFCNRWGCVVSFTYSTYVRATRSNPQVGDIVDLNERLELIALSLDQESPV